MSSYILKLLILLTALSNLPLYAADPENLLPGIFHNSQNNCTLYALPTFEENNEFLFQLYYPSEENKEKREKLDLILTFKAFGFSELKASLKKKKAVPGFWDHHQVTLTFYSQQRLDIEWQSTVKLNDYSIPFQQSTYICKSLLRVIY